MKKRITLLGSFSGRNMGDAAILSSIVEQLSKRLPGTRFEIPTTDVRFIVENLKEWKIHAFSVMPWSGSLRLLGIPVITAIFRSDLVLITNGIIFDVGLFNLAFNFVIQLAALIVVAKISKKPVVCFDVGIGPVTTSLGKRLVRFILNNCEEIMVREEDSRRLVKGLGVSTPCCVYADIALLSRVSSRERVSAICREKGMRDGLDWLGFNVTWYGQSFLEHVAETKWDDYKCSIARTLDAFLQKRRVGLAIITTHVRDIPLAIQIIELLKKKENVRLFTNAEYSPADIMGVMRELKLFAGMRLHSITLASSVGTPVVGIVYAPKVSSFLAMMGHETWEVKLSEVLSGKFLGILNEAWDKHHDMRRKLSRRLTQSKDIADRSVDVLVERYLSG